MKLQSASLRHIEPWGSRSTNPAQVLPTTGTRKDNVFFMEINTPSAPSSFPDAIDIDDLVAEIESSSPKAARAISKGRKWIAKEFYSDGPSIAGLRLNKGWSQAELAKNAATSQSYIARLELGNVDPQLSTVLKLSKILGVSIEAFAQAMANGTQT